MIVGLNETAQSLRIVEWPRLWPALGEVPNVAAPLVGGLPWTWLLLVLFPPFLPGTPRRHFVIALSIAGPNVGMVR